MVFLQFIFKILKATLCHLKAVRKTIIQSNLYFMNFITSKNQCSSLLPIHEENLLLFLKATSPQSPGIRS